MPETKYYGVDVENIDLLNIYVLPRNTCQKLKETPEGNLHVAGGMIL